MFKVSPFFICVALIAMVGAKKIFSTVVVTPLVKDWIKLTVEDFRPLESSAYTEKEYIPLAKFEICTRKLALGSAIVVAATAPSLSTVTLAPG
jgi:hypothetical protein